MPPTVRPPSGRKKERYESIATGLYNSASEVIREALRLLEERDEMRRMRLGSLRKEINVGLDQLQRGEVCEYDDRSLNTLAADVNGGIGRIKEIQGCSNSVAAS